MSDQFPAKAKGHLFAKGQSGNPAGRPKGSKNAISLIKLQIEGELRAQMKPVMGDVIKEVIRQALPKQVPVRDKDGNHTRDAEGNLRFDVVSGDKEMLTLLYNSWVPKSRASEDESPREKIQIVIGKLDQVPEIVGKVIPHKSNE